MKRDREAEKRITDFLLDNAGRKIYLSQIARGSGASGSTCYQILEKKVNQGLLEKEKLGNLSLYALNPLDPLIKQKKILRNIEILQKIIKKLKDYSSKIILYGSAASGEDEAGSDIDLFILSNEKNKVQSIISRAKLKRKIQAVIKNFLEFLELKKKDKAFYREIEKGKVLWEEKKNE